MGKIVKYKLPCLNEKCNSSDARQLYEDGTSFCFSCESWFPKEGEEVTTAATINIAKKITLEEIAEFTTRGIKDRKITLNIAEFYGVKVSYNEAGEIDTHYYPYIDSGNVSYKVRKLPKTFSTVGHFKGLFGKDKFNGGGKRLVITEGELDAMAVQQAYFKKYEKFYPVVSIPSASGIQQILDNREWVRSFNEVVLMFDMDKAGEEATNKAIKVIGIDKVRIAKMPLKDPCEVLLKKDSEDLLRCIWDATTYTPAGIIGKEELWEALTLYNSKESVPYASCLAGVNSKLKGHRTGEIVLFISGTGSGKSTLLREDMLHLLETTNDKIGVVSLEECPAETARKLAGMYLNKNPSNEEIPLNELKEGFDSVFGTDRVVILDHQGSIKDGTIVDQLEYMALVGCKYIFVDHITILVSEGAEGLTGNEAIDKVMNDLLRLVKSHDIWIGLVSHLRKTSNTGKSFEEGVLPSIDDIRGSGSIKQISFDIIAFARNLTAEDERERNVIEMSVLKARYTGLTGPVQGAYYTHSTGRLTSIDLMPDEFFAIDESTEKD